MDYLQLLKDNWVPVIAIIAVAGYIIYMKIKKPKEKKQAQDGFTELLHIENMEKMRQYIIQSLQKADYELQQIKMEAAKVSAERQRLLSAKAVVEADYNHKLDFLNKVDDGLKDRFDKYFEMWKTANDMKKDVDEMKGR